MLALHASADAVEYRLKVASVFDQALTSFLGYGELNDGATGPGFQRLGAFLNEGSGDRGMIVTQRPLTSVPDSIARAWGGVAVTAPIARGGVVSYWDEVRWDGKPGERSIWIVKSDGRMRPQSIKHVVLAGTTPLTIEQPYTADCGKIRVPGAEDGDPVDGISGVAAVISGTSTSPRASTCATGSASWSARTAMRCCRTSSTSSCEQGPSPPPSRSCSRGAAAMRRRREAAPASSGPTDRSRHLARALTGALLLSRERAPLARRVGRRRRRARPARPGCRPRTARASRMCCRRPPSRRASRSSRTRCGSTCSTTC